MQIEINEEELQEWAFSQIKKRMGDRINSLMREWDWEKYMRSAVDRVVTEKVTDKAIKSIIDSMDRDKIIETISQNIASELAESFQN